MAQGDVTRFNKSLEWCGDGTIDLDNDTFKFAFITDAFTPTATTAAPCWTADGSTNLATYEVTAGGNYFAGGITLTNVTWGESGGTVKFDSDDISLAQNASNPTNARWGVVYSDTATSKNCLLFVDLGGTTNLAVGGFSLTINASGWFTTARAA